MFKARKPAIDETWDGIVLAKSRGMPDGSFLYRYIEIELAEGTTRKIRVDRALYDALNIGDSITKRAGTGPAKT